MPDIKRYLDSIGMGVIVIALCLFFWTQSDAFATPRNISTILLHASVNIILAVGMTFVICAGEIDLSVGSLLAVCGMLTALSLKIDPETGMNLPMAAAAAITGPLPDLLPFAFAWWMAALCVFLACSLGPGLIAGGGAGLIVARFGVPSFIVTLGFMLIFRGFSRWLTNAAPITGMPPAFMNVGAGVLFEYGGFRVYYGVLIALAFVIIGALLLSRSRFGRYVLAVGGNREAAYLSGVRVGWVRCGVFMLMGVCAAAAAIVQTSRSFIGDPNAGEGYELDAIAAVIIGGASLFGGRGSVIGSLFGALIIAVLRNGLVLLGVNDHVKQMAIGGIIIFAVLLDYYRRSRSETA